MEKETTRTTSVYIDDTEKKELLLRLRNRDRRVVSCVHPSVRELIPKISSISLPGGRSPADEDAAINF